MSKIKRLTEEEKMYRKALKLRAYPLYLEIEKLKKITTSKRKKIKILTLKNVIIQFLYKNHKNDDFKLKIYHIYVKIDQNEREILGLKERIDHINNQVNKIGGSGIDIDSIE